MEEIDQMNERLKAAGVRVRVRTSGKNLALRATLPMKPGDGAGRKQYDINLRIPHNKDGLKRAEREAYKLGQSLIEGSFTWDLDMDSEADQPVKPISQLIEEFKDDSFRTYSIQEATWRNTWAGTLPSRTAVIASSPVNDCSGWLNLLECR